MKNCKYLLALLAVAVTFISCGSDGSSSDPYNDQVHRPFYPKKMTFTSVNNNNAKTQEEWSFAYNNDNTISSYTYKQNVTSDDLKITQEERGELSYYEDYKGDARITNKIYSKYTSSSKLGVTVVYSDTLTEDVTFSGSTISQIETVGKRTSNGLVETVSNLRTFTYANDFCTGSTYKDAGAETIYTYKWSGDMLSQVTVHGQNTADSDWTHDTYNYTYNDQSLATNYGFNPLAFIYGHNPRIYAAMGFFGKVTPYELEHEKYNRSQTINGAEHNIPMLDCSFNILESINSLIYNIDSPFHSEYIYKFSN